MLLVLGNELVEVDSTYDSDVVTVVKNVDCSGTLV